MIDLTEVEAEILDYTLDASNQSIIIKSIELSYSCKENCENAAMFIQEAKIEELINKMANLKIGDKVLLKEDNDSLNRGHFSKYFKEPVEVILPFYFSEDYKKSALKKSFSCGFDCYITINTGDVN